MPTSKEGCNEISFSVTHSLALPPRSIPRRACGAGHGINCRRASSERAAKAIRAFQPRHYLALCGSFGRGGSRGNRASSCRVVRKAGQPRDRWRALGHYLATMPERVFLFSLVGKATSKKAARAEVMGRSERSSPDDRW